MGNKLPVVASLRIETRSYPDAKDAEVPSLTHEARLRLIERP